ADGTVQHHNLARLVGAFDRIGVDAGGVGVVVGCPQHEFVAYPTALLVVVALGIRTQIRAAGAELDAAGATEAVGDAAELAGLWADGPDIELVVEQDF